MDAETNNSKKINLQIEEIIPPNWHIEHGIYAYYGRIGQGKTYAMTADIISALMKGKVVYTNYPIEWEGFDQREFWPMHFFALFGLKRKFFRFRKENLHHIDIDEHFHDKFAELTDCIVALDEGYVVFDSYELAKMSMKKRKNVLHTRHFDRSIWYTTQRPNAVHITMRSQTNVFFKVTKLWDTFFTIFRREEFDLGSDDGVDETNAFSTKLYLGKNQIFNAYNTKYLRYGARSSQELAYDIFKMSIKEAWIRLFKKFANFVPLKRHEVSKKLSTDNYLQQINISSTMKIPQSEDYTERGVVHNSTVKKNKYWEYLTRRRVLFGADK
jgi:hypothetical protein